MIESERKKSLSCVQLFATTWTIAYQAPPSMGFSKQRSWSGLPLPSPGDLPDPGIQPRSSRLQAVALPSEPPVTEGFKCKLKYLGPRAHMLSLGYLCGSQDHLWLPQDSLLEPTPQWHVLVSPSPFLPSIMLVLGLGLSLLALLIIAWTVASDLNHPRNRQHPQHSKYKLSQGLGLWCVL